MNRVLCENGKISQNTIYQWGEEIVGRVLAKRVKDSEEKAKPKKSGSVSEGQDCQGQDTKINKQRPHWIGEDFPA